MRKLDWIAAKLGYVRREYPRFDNGSDAIQRGERWQNFYAENGGLRDMIDGLRRGYFEKVGTLKPGDTDALIALGIADKVARDIDQQVRNVIETGKIAVAHKAAEQRNAALSR